MGSVRPLRRVPVLGRRRVLRRRGVPPLRAGPDEPPVGRVPGYVSRGPRVCADARRLPVGNGEVHPRAAGAYRPFWDLGRDPLGAASARRAVRRLRSSLSRFRPATGRAGSPPPKSEVTAVLEGFLDARVDGAGAGDYVHPYEEEGPPPPDQEVPLLYATTGGTPYERYEIERVQGPVWPTGWSEFEVRLFAEDGTVVEQSFVVVRQDGRLGVVYGSQSGPRIPTTENGQAVPVPYSLLDGEVTFAAAPPWSPTSLDRTSTTLGGVGRGAAVQFTRFTITADPRTGMGCEAGPPAADAGALVRSIRSNPDLEATAPVAVSVGGIDALRMDVLAPGRPEVGDLRAHGPRATPAHARRGADARVSARPSRRDVGADPGRRDQRSPLAVRACGEGGDDRPGLLRVPRAWEAKIKKKSRDVKPVTEKTSGTLKSSAR